MSTTTSCQDGLNEFYEDRCEDLKRKRGQQNGAKGHGRKHHLSLPSVEVTLELPEAERCCPKCGKPLLVFPGTEVEGKHGYRWWLWVVITEDQAWVKRINEIFYLNDKRLLVLSNSQAFGERDQQLRHAGDAMADLRERELAGSNLHKAARKVLESLRRHWQGCTLFVEHPEIHIDNNESERRLRDPAVGRKNYYGSGSVWSGALTAMSIYPVETTYRYCGRIFTAEQMNQIRDIIASGPQWNRAQLSRLVCDKFNHGFHGFHRLRPDR